ncbi:hypothetical protein BRDID11004_16150 [Bradyrhizobium diazoefficiens]|uniref:Peptidase M41 domain-containing protein n=1 Tax=Bradyrhizobium diazoefficiens TaxID=1355477 RepID=A0A810A4T3_9BRAD|nr:hypothetical protein [Bradyrhizobium diazoefficiens]BBZ97473.1 hypothetical protein F07S3_73060 [Bradyrhizobium diazoefficiens]BCA15157.1 hypothetical protein BDHF08_70040 [Bradyrhizobium diazoefficiens]BCE59569.1 hypothetical protein XF5B_70810 [Bradyrhizobium diazoefficiens]BCE68252.1 hypothetical protein XF6B_70510 [Bradyrhizobium diazoefficiens]
MSEGTPAEDGNEQPATSVGGPGAAAQVEVGDNGSGPDGETDEYGELLAALGRTFDQDCRIAIHESGHIIAARLLGNPLGGATADPGPGYEGRVWGERHVEAFAEGGGDASDVRETLASVMPGPGEDRSSVADVFASVYGHCIELAAGRAAEHMLLGDDDKRSALDDLRQARELALLICKSEGAVESFIAHCDIAARDLLMPYGDVVMTLSIVLRIKRTLDGAEIDQIIRDVETRKALALEQRRRAEWRKSELAAARFRVECEPLPAARSRHCSHDQAS